MPLIKTHNNHDQDKLLTLCTFLTNNRDQQNHKLFNGNATTVTYILISSWSKWWNYVFVNDFSCGNQGPLCDSRYQLP